MLRDPDNGIALESLGNGLDLPMGRPVWTKINGATSENYTPGVANVGSYLRATASYTDSVGPDKSARAVTSAPVRIDDDGTVTLSWEELTVGEGVTASLTDLDNGVMNVEWQWASSADGSANWTDIVGATSETYTPVEGNVNSYLRATASYDDAAGIGKSARAVSSAAVIADDDGVVTLSTSEPEVGAAVTATLSDPDDGVTNVSWQWAKLDDGSTGWTDIQGATSASYRPGKSDEGVYLRATASYDDAVGIGKSAQAVSSATVIADDDGVVTLSTSEPEVGAAVTATLSDPDDGVMNVSWQWAKLDDGSTGWMDIQGAMSASYTPGKSDEGIYLRATASYDDAAGIGKSAQVITSTGVAQMELLTKYDSDRNGSIDRSEAIDAVTDYFNDEITKDEVLAVLVLYFSG